MKIEKTFIDGLLVITPDVFKDSRGFFYESFNNLKYKDIGLNLDFVQDNISKSSKNTIRGLHYQIGEYAQGKLCSVIQGKVLDIAVDIRFGSDTFGKYFKIELDENDKKQIWVPPGFAHGFAVLEDETIFTYKCTANYNKESERTIIYNDPDLNIDWQIKQPIISEKDKLGKHLKDIEKDFSLE